MSEKVIGVVRRYFPGKFGQLDVYIEGRDDIAFQVKAKEEDMQSGSTIEFATTDKRFGKKVVCSGWKAVAAGDAPKPAAAGKAAGTTASVATAAQQANDKRQTSIVRQSQSAVAANLLSIYVAAGAVALPEKQAKKLDVLRALFLELRDELVAYAVLEEKQEAKPSRGKKPVQDDASPAGDDDDSDEDVVL